MALAVALASHRFKLFVAQTLCSAGSSSDSVRLKHKYPKQVRERLDYSKVPEIDFEGKDKKDVEENYMRGGGPGGQAVATTSNAVQLKHLPTGLTVKCHETRSLDQNRKLARLRLVEALDHHLNKEQSIEAQATRIRAALHEAAKAAGKVKQARGLLKRLKEKESQLAEKLDRVKENAGQYTHPEQKIEEIGGKLAEVRQKIREIEAADDDGENEE